MLDAEDDVDEATDDAVAVKPVAMQGPAIFGRSIEPVSLNPDPLLGFLSRQQK